MEIPKNALNWFEIPVVDFDRARHFYNTIFDCEMPENVMNGHRMGFFVYDFKNGGIGGAIVAGDDYCPGEKGSLIYLNAGDDLQTVLDRIEAAGGKILQPKTKINDDIGYFAFFRDTEGNRVALHSMN